MRRSEVCDANWCLIRVPSKGASGCLNCKMYLCADGQAMAAFQMQTQRTEMIDIDGGVSLAMVGLDVTGKYDYDPDGVENMYVALNGDVYVRFDGKTVPNGQNIFRRTRLRR